MPRCGGVRGGATDKKARKHSAEGAGKAPAERIRPHTKSRAVRAPSRARSRERSGSPGPNPYI